MQRVSFHIRPYPRIWSLRKGSFKGERADGQEILGDIIEPALLKPKHCQGKCIQKLLSEGKMSTLDILVHNLT